MGKCITVHAIGQKDGTIDIHAHGDTYRLKDDFKRLGFRWERSAWWITGANPAAMKDISEWLKKQSMIEVFIGARLAFRSADMTADGTSR